MRPHQEKYCFSANVLPAFIGAPLEYLSMVTAAPVPTHFFDAVLRNSHHYTAEKTDHLLVLLDALAASSGAFYSVMASAGLSKLELSSANPHVVTIAVDDYTFSNHSYAERYFRFTKHIPAKGGPGLHTMYRCEVDRREKKNEKDILSLIQAVFHGCRLSVVSDLELQIPGLEMEDKNAAAAGTLLQLPLTCPGSSQQAFAHLTTVEPDESHDIFEYLSLLHLNAVPDVSDSHVANTMMYEFPDKLSLDAAGAPLHLASVSNVSPQAFYELVNCADTFSVMARTSTHSYLTVRAGGNVYSWECQY